MNGLEAEFDGEIEFVRLNVDEAENGRIQQEYGLRGHPSVAILNGNGDVAKLYFGAETAVTLKNVLDDLVE